MVKYTDNCVCGATRSGRHKFIGLMARRLVRSGFYMQAAVIWGPHGGHNESTVFSDVTPYSPVDGLDHFQGKLLKFRRDNCFHPQGRSDQLYPHFYSFQRSRLGHGLNDLAIESRQGQKMFLFSKSSETALKRTQQPNEWVPGFFPGGAVAGA